MPETAKTLEDLIIMIGISAQDEPTLHAVCLRDKMWQTAPILWAASGTERIEVYQISLTAKPLRTITIGDEQGSE